VTAGFVVITAKAAEPEAFVQVVRDFARAVRANAAESGLADVTADRQLRREELGGAVPYDQMNTCYAARKVTFPTPFFCKIVPV